MIQNKPLNKLLQMPASQLFNQWLDLNHDKEIIRSPWYILQRKFVYERIYLWSCDSIIHL